MTDTTPTTPTLAQECTSLQPLHLGKGVQPLIQVGKELTQIIQVETFKPAVAVPEGNKLVPLDPLKLVRPRFLVANPVFIDVVAFIAYVNEFKTPETRIFYSRKGEFQAVFDWHQASGPTATAQAQHGDHHAQLKIQHTPEWLTWTGSNEKSMGQQDFAEFLEDNALDLIEPSIETMLQVARGLTATIGGNFKSVINQTNGSSAYTFEEMIEGRVSGTVPVEIPNDFKIALAPFIKGNRYPIECRLRYRLGGGLKFHYKALHLQWILDVALEEMVAEVGTKTGIAPGLGEANTSVFKTGQ